MQEAFSAQIPPKIGSQETSGAFLPLSLCLSVRDAEARRRE
jgi:hypothetical protein